MAAVGSAGHDVSLSGMPKSAGRHSPATDALSQKHRRHKASTRSTPRRFAQPNDQFIVIYCGEAVSSVVGGPTITTVRDFAGCIFGTSVI